MTEDKRGAIVPKNSESTKIFDRKYGGRAASVGRGSRWGVAAQAVVIKGVKAASGVRKFCHLLKRCHSCILADIPASPEK